MVNLASEYTHVFVIVGDNDARYLHVDAILENFLAFKDAIRPTRVKFAGHMRRNDLPADLVSSSNIFLAEALGINYKSTKMIKPSDFDSDPGFHFEPFGEGYRHLGAMILSVFEEFCKRW